MSVVAQRPTAPAPPAVPITQPMEISRFVWWSVATLILFCAIYFHSKTDPGIRFAVKHSGLTNYGPSWWTQQKFGQFTPGDVAVFVFAYAGLVERFRTGRLGISNRMAWLVGLGTTAVLVGIAAGVYHETQSPFGDWRNLALGLVYAFALWSTVLRTDRDCFRFAQIFVAILTGYGAWQLVQYASGGGEIAFYGRTTVGDHATLEFMVAAVGVSMAMLRTHRSRFLWMAGVAVGTSVVVLAFRRYAWVELAAVFAAFVLFSGVNRRRYVVSIAAVAVGVPPDHRAHLVVARLGWAIRQPRSDPDSSGQHLRDDQPGAYQRHPGRLRRGEGASRSPGSGWASSTTDSARPSGRATPGWCTTPRSRSGSSSGSSA